MESGSNKQEAVFTSQEVEEIVFLEEIEKELENVEKSFDSGDMQSFGRNRDDVMLCFVEYRKRDEEVLRRLADITSKHDSNKKEDVQDEWSDIFSRKEKLIQSRDEIHENTTELKKLLDEISGYIADNTK